MSKPNSKALIVKIKKIDERAVTPSRAHETDSGWDLTVIDVHKIKGDTIFFRTGLQVQPPSGYYFEIFPRSSISELPMMLANSAGIIDESYTGELIIPIRVLHPSLGTEPSQYQFPGGLVRMLDSRPPSMLEAGKLLISKKPRIAQMILRKRIDFQLEEVESLEDTARGDGGFGSTG